VFGHRKFAGNAQAITKGRWLHHTSFLWDFQGELMRLLKHPSRAPEYRAVSTSVLGNRPSLSVKRAGALVAGSVEACAKVLLEHRPSISVKHAEAICQACHVQGLRWVLLDTGRVYLSSVAERRAHHACPVQRCSWGVWQGCNGLVGFLGC
jgi:hypothetical protein